VLWGAGILMRRNLWISYVFCYVTRIEKEKWCSDKLK